MKTPVIKRTGKYQAHGSFGSYFVLNAKKKIGVKVLNDRYRVKDLENNFKSFLDKDIMNGFFYKNNPLTDAAKEIVAIQMLALSGKTPKPIGLCWVDRGKYFEIGIVMEHIAGKTLYEHCQNNDKVDNWNYDKMEMKYRGKWIKDFGIDVQDWHNKNIMVDRKGKQYRIDFSPGYFDLETDRKDEYYQRVMYEVLSLVENFPGVVI